MSDSDTIPPAAGRPTELVMVDGSSYLYRAFHALPPLSNSRGQPTGAVYGVINMLRKLLREHQPQRIAVVFDAPGKTFRDELFESYKSHRPPMPDDLRSQIEPLHAAVSAMGIPLLQIPGVEADDVIGTLARQAGDAGIHTLISTGDKDMAQLVNGHVTLVNTMTGTVLDRQGVIDKFGVPPERIIDYLALVGDSSDNIPGVPKVGPKTAAKWLNEYGSLDEIIARAEEIPGKVGESLRANLPQLELSRLLATIHCDVKLAESLDQLSPSEPDTDKLRELYTELEFGGLLRELEADQPDPPRGSESPRRYQTVLDQKTLDGWLERIKHADLFAFDTETTSLRYDKAEVVGVSFAIEPGEAAYVPLAHNYMGAPEQLNREAVLAQLKPILEDPKHAKVGQNLKYDKNVLANHGIELTGVAHDTMLQSYVLNSTAGRHDMDSMALRELGVTTIKFEDVAGKGARQLGFDEVEIEKAAEYAAEDADITLRLHQSLWPRLNKETRLRAVYEEMEVPLVPVLSRMEQTGVLVDPELLRRQSQELAKAMADLEVKAHDEAGQAFNLGSPKQLQEILFDKLQLPALRKTPKGQPSTAEDVLQELANDYRLPQLILEYRSLSKLKSTYTDKLPDLISPKTGRIHTSYHQAVAATGRLSSSEPNLQNIPIRTAEGRRIREAFVAPKGYRILSADYSQIELRIMAHLSGDAGLLKAFAEGKDIHQATASEVFGVSPDQVSADQRRSAKAINFGLIYGMSAFGLSRQLGIERSAAQTYVDRYFDRYPGVKDFMDRIQAQAHEDGYVETVFGRRLYLPEINSRNAQRRQYAERTAINAPMQGTAADIIKRAMLAIDRWLNTSNNGIRMIMQVHDELVFEVPKSQISEAETKVRKFMISAAELKTPLDVDIGTGRNWGESH